MANSAAEALKVFGGMYGSAWKDGVQLLEAVEVAAAAEVGRIEIPIVGSTKTGYKPGRESREGTLRVQKKDTKWEHFVHDFLSQSLEERRANRGMDCDALEKHYREMDITDYLNDHDLMPNPENRAKALEALTAHL